jgi:Fic family protein
MNFNIIDKLKETLDSYRPLPNAIVKNINESLVIDWTYNSNAIEGNSLTLSETRMVLEGLTIGGKRMIEHLEVINHKEAIEFMEELAKNNNSLIEFDIKQIHSLVLAKIDKDNSGTYRKTDVIITGSKHIPPAFYEVAGKMADFINKYKKDKEKYHPVELATRVHYDFVHIHPFIDGNGRTSRLLMNLELIKAGFPPTVIKVEDRSKYIQALQEVHAKQDYNPFIEFIKKVVEKSFEPYFYCLSKTEEYKKILNNSVAKAVA